MENNSEMRIPKGFQMAVAGFVVTVLSLFFAIMIWAMVDAINLTGEHKELAVICMVAAFAGLLKSISGLMVLRRAKQVTGLAWAGIVAGLITMAISGLNHKLLQSVTPPTDMVEQIESAMDTSSVNSALEQLNSIIPDSTESNH
jgi:hypothetical protein